MDQREVSYRREMVSYRRVLTRLISNDDLQERSYLLKSDRAKIEAVLDRHDKAAPQQRRHR